MLRTTLIVGFPTETEEEFEELLDFVEEVKFDHLGAFTYSREEGTKSYSMNGQVKEDVKVSRLNRLMTLQRKISYRLNKKYEGQLMCGMVVNHDRRNDTYELRNGWNAPDDVDGKIIFTSSRELKTGQMVRVKITKALVYDLYGEEIY